MMTETALDIDTSTPTETAETEQAPAPVETAPAPVETAETAPAPVETADNPWYQSLPETWRNDVATLVAGDDDEAREKTLKQLSRVADIPTLVKSYTEAQRLISQGVHKGKKPETPEELAVWREQNGIPADVDKYKEALGEDIPDEFGKLLETAVDQSLPPEATKAMLDALVDIEQGIEQEQSQQDMIDAQTARQKLEKTWGPDTKTNLNVVTQTLQQLPEEVRDMVINARMPDGRSLLNTPEVVVWMADLARKANPTAAILPNTSNPLQSIEDELKSLQEKIGTDEWYRDENSQKRYMELINAKQQLNAG